MVRETTDSRVNWDTDRRGMTDTVGKQTAERAGDTDGGGNKDTERVVRETTDSRVNWDTDRRGMTDTASGDRGIQAGRILTAVGQGVQGRYRYSRSPQCFVPECFVSNARSPHSRSFVTLGP